ncbi:MAG: chemotaxis protein CheA [Gammaproteobacteria bacterium]|nr:chemotaxis protein CheA [Gammaproteobacteria bacterium]
MSDDSLQIFADEAEDLLGVAEQALLNLDDLDNEADTLEGINDLFRTFHTIKGAAGLFGLDSIVDFTHIVESVLGKVREGVLSVDDDMVSLFLLSRDHLNNLVENGLSDADGMSDELKLVDAELVDKLNAYLGVPATTQTAAESKNSVECVDNENWFISLRFGPNALRNGMDPASFIGYLSNIGDINNIRLIDDALPRWRDFDPENCYLGFEIELIAPDTDKDTIEEVFEFVQDDCKISILPPHSQIDSYIRMIEELDEEDMRIGDILVACGAITSNEKDDVLNYQDHLADKVTADSNQKVPPLGKVAVEQHVVEQEVVDAALKKQGELKQQRVNTQQTIRVNALKLENLVDLVGELVIGSANSELNARRLGDADLNEAMENLLRLVEEVRDTALGLRMVQIGETFNRYKRVVREVSRDTGKDIDLKINGAETELDKTLIEKIGDPLMHLVRNAIDHGIESPEQRVGTGKPVKGTVSLDAFHDSGSIVIQIKDDGGGLAKDKIISKALEKGLIQENQQLSDQEVFRLIFEAGFSTADQVSNLSGRGVGMDVVRRNIESLRGHIEIESEEGKGTTISIRLPLTLAIIDGFQVRVGDAQYIVPLDMVDECIELNESLRGGDEQANYVNLRGEILPFMHLSELFGSNRVIDEKHRDNIVVVQFAGKKAGFVVDELLGEHQTVIKPLGKVFQHLKGISGATILGSGEVAMIIDIPEMVNRVVSSGQKQSGVAKAIH